MSGLDWEKQNRKESTDPIHLADIANHARKRQLQTTHLAKKKARLIALERKLQDPYKRGIEVGEERERERIIAILKSYAPHLITDGLMQLISARTHENQEQK